VVDIVQRDFCGEAAALRGGDAASFADGDGGLETEVAEDGVARRAGLATVDLSPRAAKATFALNDALKLRRFLAICRTS
jgi:hypothetical protein